MVPPGICSPAVPGGEVAAVTGGWRWAGPVCGRLAEGGGLGRSGSLGPLGLLAGEQGPWGAPRVCARLTIMSPDLAQSIAYSDLVGRERPAAVTPVIDWRALRTADRACCCPARPVVVAVMPPAPGRDHPTDLLLCAHHYRVSRAALDAVGAAVFDGAGRQVMPPARVLLGER